MSSTRQQMIETAVRMFQREGYNATSWRGLVEEAGTPWGSIHHHFPGGKEELGVAAIDAASGATVALIRFCFQENPDPVGAVARWFELSADLLSLSDYSAGCPVGTVALETASSSETIRAATRAAFRSWQAELSRHLRGAGVATRVARETSEGLIALFEGGLMLARVEARRRPMETAGRQAESIVAAALAG